MIEELRGIIDEVLYVSKFIIYDKPKKDVKEHRKIIKKLNKKLEEGKISECITDDSDIE